MKKCFGGVLMLAVLISCLVPVSSHAQEPESAEAVAVSTPEEFEAMEPTGNYYLAGDIDFGGKVYETWILEAFSGTLDGRGHCLWNFSVSSAADSARKEGGVFRYIGSAADTVIENLQIGKPGANIPFTFLDGGWAYGALAAAHGSQNYKLTLDRVVIYADLSVSNGNNTNIGGFLGASMNCVMSDCSYYGSVTGKTTNNWINVAGFSANPKKVTGGSFVNCRNFGDITVYSSVTSRAGGIAGYAAADVKMTGCMNFGTIDLEPFAEGKPLLNARLGGIIAESAAANCVFEECFNFGEVLSPVHAGGIIGYNCKASAVRNCVNYGELTAKNPEVPAGAIYAASEAEMTASGNQDMTGALAGASSDAVKPVGTQTTAVADGLFNIRFLSALDSRNYTSAGFDVDVFYHQDGVLVSRHIPLTGYHVYSSVFCGSAEGDEMTAAELGGEYLTAISVLDVPAGAEYGTMTFVYRPWVKNGDSVVYGESALCICIEGTFVFAGCV